MFSGKTLFKHQTACQLGCQTPYTVAVGKGISTIAFTSDIRSARPRNTTFKNINFGEFTVLWTFLKWAAELQQIPVSKQPTTTAITVVTAINF